MSTTTNVRLACLVMLASFSSAWAIGPAKKFTPQWDIGSSWAVRTEYRQKHVADATRSTGWSEPVVFVYRVARKTQENGNTIYGIIATPQAANTGFETEIELCLTADQKLSVRSVISKRPKLGTISSDRIDYSLPGPVFTDNSAAPYDSPCFPLVKPANLDGSNYITTKKSVSRIEDVGGLRFVRLQSQLLKPAGPGSTYVDSNGKPISFDVAVDPSSVYPVEMRDETNGQRVVQYWGQGQPWFLYSENGSTRSWLVKQ